MAAPVAGAHEGRAPAATVVAAEPVPPVTPPEASPPADQSQPAPDAGMDDDAIVVTAQARADPGDPLETVNAQSFEAVQAVDMAVVGPVAHGYQQAVPSPVRRGVHNFINNLDEPIIFLNFLLQLKLGKAGETLGRFAINSTIGVAGLIDVAQKRPFSLPHRPNGFADTMGYYGMKPGIYLFLPLVGSTTLRDALGGGLDLLVLPVSVGKPFSQITFTLAKGALSSIDDRVEIDERLRRLRDDNPDPYTAIRDDYLKRREARIDELRGRHRAPSNPGPEVASPANLPPTPSE